MTAAVPLSRALSKQLLATSTRPLTRPAGVTTLLRAPSTCIAGNGQAGNSEGFRGVPLVIRAARTYATAAKASPSKAKTASKPASTKKTAKKTPKKAVKKTAKKTPKKATAVKKSKAKKPPSKAALARAASAKNAELKAKALIGTEPKILPNSAYLLFAAQELKNAPKGTPVVGTVRAAKQKFDALDAEEREALNHEANENKTKNHDAYKRWVNRHTPKEIREANLARQQMNQQAKKAGKTRKIRPIRDDRQVSRPLPAYVFFALERRASGDYKGITMTEASKLVAKEWSELSQADKKQFEDKAAADKARYIEEHTTVYGYPPPLTENAEKS